MFTYDVIERRREWIAALRSGEYAQTRRRLHDDKGMCCLGVLCDLEVRRGNGLWIDADNPLQYDGDDAPPDLKVYVTADGYDEAVSMPPGHVAEDYGVYALYPWFAGAGDAPMSAKTMHTLYGGLMDSLLSSMNDEEEYTFEGIANALEVMVP